MEDIIKDRKYEAREQIGPLEEEQHQDRGRLRETDDLTEQKDIRGRMMERRTGIGGLRNLNNRLRDTRSD